VRVSLASLTVEELGRVGEALAAVLVELASESPDGE
jgi:hypothetical protein